MTDPFSPAGRFEQRRRDAEQQRALEKVVARTGATPADIPGLWNVPGYPELTTAQLFSLKESQP